MDLAESEQTECIVMGLSGLTARTLNTLGILQHVPKRRIVETLDDARQAARGILGA